MRWLFILLVVVLLALAEAFSSRHYKPLLKEGVVGVNYHQQQTLGGGTWKYRTRPLGASASLSQNQRTDDSSKSKLLVDDDDDDDADKKMYPKNGEQIPPLGKSHRRPRSRTLSPYQIRHPEIAELLKISNDPGVPFYQAFRTIQEALETIANASSSEELIRILGDLAVNSDADADAAESTVTSILRIEQVLSHSADPLGWLYAQNQRQITISSNNNNLDERKDALFYIQSTVETAVVGAAWTWNQPTNHGEQKDAFWTMVSNLPDSSHLYGGERFDTRQSNNNNKNKNTRHSDWNDFGATWWILPAVELREEPAEHVFAETTTQNKNSTKNVLYAGKRTTLAVHLVCDPNMLTKSWQVAARETLQLLQRLSDAVMDEQVPATTLPPVLMRDLTYAGPDNTQVDGQELYEQGVTAALEAFAKNGEDNSDGNEQPKEKAGLKKVVLARRMDLQFEANLSALDILRKWKYNEVHEGGNMFYMRPMGQEEFFGCTPERLFTIQKGSNVVLSEALAGTRPRGTSQAADNQLLRDLFGSLKDRNENVITAKFIQDVFAQLGDKGLVETAEILRSSSILEDTFDTEGYGINRTHATKNNSSSSISSGYFVRRLRHLQHICQRFSAKLASKGEVVEVVRHLLDNLHPTPAVCGFPAESAMDFIRQHESIGFDRGFYAGPVGYMGRDAADILVGIRSGLVSTVSTNSLENLLDQDDVTGSGTRTKVSVYAGAGIVPGSTVQGEWAETSYKLGVISSLFPQSPMTLQSSPTANVAWANAFVEELIRNGVTQFYVCPGSRSTPLVVAIAKAARSNVGVVHAVSVHDERVAGFRAVGYGRGANRLAAIITSSGTAIANLYPAIVEAGMDGVPVLLLTADRPYENRDTGSNQAIDQVKAFSSSYVRWFRDILPPHDDVPVAAALADAGHAVTVAKSQRGPVHINIQFRENLAPNAGQVRGDNRANSITSFDGFRFTDVPGFNRWSKSGDRWLKSYQLSSGDFGMGLPHGAVAEIARLILRSKRGIIVVGNIRRPTDENDMEALAATYDTISDFAQTIGFPIIAGVQSAQLRFSSSAVIPYAEHILKNPTIRQNIKPDLIIQIGAPLVSTEVPAMIASALRDDSANARHILLHPHHGSERMDPSFTVSRRVVTEISPFLKALARHLDKRKLCQAGCSSELSPLVRLGRQLQREVPDIISKVSETISKQSQIPGVSLTEPEVAMVLAMMMSNSVTDQSLFLSNSMPIRDCDSFLYPASLPKKNSNRVHRRGTLNVGSNRGASGIDGIVASATGFAEATGTNTTLLIGDLSALHDLNSFYSLTSGTTSAKRPLTTILVNNDGGGIFSFLPVAKYGADVAFDEFFGTPTKSFDYKQGLEAFGLEVRQVSRFDSLCNAYAKAMGSNQSSVIEASVVERSLNVEVHEQINDGINSFINDFVGDGSGNLSPEPLPIKQYCEKSSLEKRKTLVLLHGWMGDKTEWDEAAISMTKYLGKEWDVLSMDLPAHGASTRVLSDDRNLIRASLKLNSGGSAASTLSIDEMAKAVLASLSQDYGITKIDALAGYSLGGRVALAMKRLCSSAAANARTPTLLADNSKLILLSSYPGVLPVADGAAKSGTTTDDETRIALDERLAREVVATADRAELQNFSSIAMNPLWSDFLMRWYGMAMWGSLNANGRCFNSMIEKRGTALSYRGRDLAEALRQSSPPRNSNEDWRGAQPQHTLFLAGEKDKKYMEIGQFWSSRGIQFSQVLGSGHALLVEASERVASEISSFVTNEISATATTSLVDQVFWDLRQKDQDDNVDAVSLMKYSNSKLRNDNTNTISGRLLDEWKFTRTIDSLEFSPFLIAVVDESTTQNGISGIGWGDQAKKSSQMTNRSGYIIQLVTQSGSKVGLGEVSPLLGLHRESLEDAEAQLLALQAYLDDSRGSVKFSAPSVLALNGGVSEYLNNFARQLGLSEFVPSLRSGLEMALVSLASQVMQSPVHEALLEFAPGQYKPASLDALVPLNGIITRGSGITQKRVGRAFPSLKVKVGHRDVMEDISALSQALQQIDSYNGPAGGTLRADANRAWDDATAMQFAAALERANIRAAERIEFIEEPLKRQTESGWSLEAQVFALEQWYKRTGVHYALDETLAEIASQCNYDFQKIRETINLSFSVDSRGCAAFVLKPALIGMELSLQLARMARHELSIGAVFSSSFDSGVGLAHTSIIAALSDASGKTMKYSHGVGTFTMLESDTLDPPFSSYVNKQGFLKIASLGRALNGLGLDDLRDSHVFNELPLSVISPALELPAQRSDKKDANYEAATATSSGGREINLIVSLPLPFSADIAVSRFTDFPQQSRWSPWIRSVRYLDDGRETEWTLNVRGVEFKWRAVSTPLEPPLKGIKWESISGLKNKGYVEFDATSEDACLMKVRMSIMTPRILASIFQSTSIFVEDFLQNKLLKWSLEMFRDVVKGDLALQRGDVELGDALFGSVEGKASAIEATLSMSTPFLDSKRDSGSNEESTTE